ncbi:MAG TPA: signal peptidase I [Gaiellaceae bacterium]
MAVACFIGALAVLFFTLAPAQLGGSVIYTSTVGDSMEPMLHKGDLVLVRPASHVAVGDVVLYESPVLHRPVLHRIYAIRSGRYVFKGDHNGFVDPGSVGRSELLGTLWFHVPKAGNALSFIGKPSHSAGLAGLAVLALAFPARARRRRRRGRRELKTHLRHLHRPRHPAEDAGTIVLVAAAAAALAVGFTTPARKSAPIPGAYSQSGVYSYLAKAVRPNVAYPDGYAHTGQPLFLSAVNMTALSFSYRFSSAYSHGMRGTIGIVARISSETSSWHHTYVLVKPRSFSGDHAAIRTVVALKALGALADQLAVDAGTSTIEHDIVITAVVRGHAYVNGHPVELFFAPQLPFTMSNALIKLAVAAPSLPAGVTYGQSSAATDLEAALHPSVPGSIPGKVANQVRIAQHPLSVLDLRGIGIGLIGLAAIVIATRPWRRRRDVWTPEQRAALKSGCVVVAVATLDPRESTIEVADFANLVGFARYLERPILHDVERALYAVEDGGRWYVSAAAAPAAALPVLPPPTRRRKGVPLRWIGAGLVLVVVAGLVISFTDANVVPLSNAGVSSDATSLAELLPSHCIGMSLSHLIVSTSGTSTGTSGNDLILDASAAKGTLTGGAGNDCIVSGASKETIDGGVGTDVCIGTGSGTVFKNCEATYTSLG